MKTKYENPDPETWVVYAKIPRTLFHEFRDLGLVPQIDLIIENAIKNAVDIEKRGTEYGRTKTACNR